MKKYYEISNKQFSQIYNLYKDLDKSYKELLKKTNKNYDSIINSLQGVINRENATEAVNNGIDELIAEAKSKSEIFQLKVLSWFCSLGFILMSLLSGVAFSDTPFSYSLFLLVLTCTVGYGYWAIRFILRLYKQKELHNAKYI
jgi:hypothetical protein